MIANAPRTVTLCQRNWKELVDAAIFDTDPGHFSERIQEARDAIMDEIEDRRLLSDRDRERTSSPEKRHECRG
jgi:hypothetical protein